MSAPARATTRAPSHPRTTVHVNGREVHFFFDEDSWVHQLMRNGLRGAGYEQGTAHVIRHFLKPGDTFVDVGAHVGVFSCCAAALVGETGGVFAFEPDPVNFARLSHHRAYNALHHIDLHRVAVGDRAGLVEFFVNSDNDGGHALWDVRGHHFNEKTRANPSPPTRIIQVKLDDFPEITSLRLLKIDTEGAELRVLRGAEGLIERFHPQIIAEINPFGLSQLGDSPQKLVDFMAAKGYKALRITDSLPFLDAFDPESLGNSDSVFNVLFLHTDDSCDN